MHISLHYATAALGLLMASFTQGAPTAVAHAAPVELGEAASLHPRGNTPRLLFSQELPSSHYMTGQFLAWPGKTYIIRVDADVTVNNIAVLSLNVDANGWSWEPFEPLPATSPKSRSVSFQPKRATMIKLLTTVEVSYTRGILEVIVVADESSPPLAPSGSVSGGSVLGGPVTGPTDTGPSTSGDSASGPAGPAGANNSSMKGSASAESVSGGSSPV